MVDNFRLTVDSNTEIEPLDSVRDVRMRGQTIVDNRVANIPQMTGATVSSNGSAGVVPAPSSSDREKYLKGDGTWAEVSSGGSTVSVTQKLSSGANIASITVDGDTTELYAPQNDPNAVVDVEVNGVSVVNANNVAEITITESVTDVVDAHGSSLVDVYGVAHVTGEVVDVVNGEGDSLVDANGIAHVTGDITDVVDGDGDTLVDNNGVAHVAAKVTDVQFDGISILDNNNVANIKTPFTVFSAPTLDYDNAAYITESNTWNDRNEHTWVAPCDCVIYACSPNSNTVKFTIGSFTYATYKNMYGNYNNYVTSNLYTMLPVAKGTTVTIQFIGAIDSQTTYKKIRYIPFKKASSSQGLYLQPYLDYSNKVNVSWEDPESDGGLICEYTATADGMLYLGLMYNTNQCPMLKYNINNNTSINYIARGDSLSNSVILSKGDTINIYDTGYASEYEYSGSLKFIPFEKTNNLNNVVSPIPDYANMQILDTSSMPVSFNAGYLFNCRYNSGNYDRQCNIELTNPQSDPIILYSNSSSTIMRQSLMPLNGTESFVSIQDLCDSGSVYFIPYADIDEKAVMVSDVKVNGSSVVDSNGVANITGSGGSTVTITPTISTGTKIADYSIDGTSGELYAPNGGGGGGSTVSVTRNVLTGENFADITIDGVTTPLYATDTTYNDYSGATSQAAGTHGLVPSAAVAEKDMFLKGDGSWDTPDAGSDVSVTQILSSGTKLGTITVDNVDTDLYAPTPTTYSDFVGTDGTAVGTHGLVPAPTASDTNKYLKSDGTWATVSGGGGATDLDDLSDVDITTPSNGQVLKYNSTSQKWENGTGGGGASDLDDLTDVDITSPTGGQILKYNSTTQKWENVDTGGTVSSIFSSFDTLMLSDRYASGTLSTRFNFSMSETVDDWSTSATIYNNTAIDITSYDEIEIDVTITDQTGSGAFWVTLSTIKYTWGGSQWPTIYANVDSAIKITETGTYTIDTSNLSGNYYIYVGGTTGKSTVTHGDCVNNNNGGITGYVTAINGIVGGSGIIPNPQGTPTDTLETIEINGTIYDIAGNGGGKDYVKKRYVYTLTVGGSWEYFTDPQSDNPLLVEAVGGGAIRSYRVNTDLLPTYESYTTIGTDIMGHAINMCKSSNGDIGISVNDSSISGETVKVYEVIGYSIESNYERTPLYITPVTIAGEITLDDDITNYDDIEFVVDYDGSTGVFRCNTTEFINSFPNIVSPTITTPHFLLSPYEDIYCRSIMGTDNNKIYIYDIFNIEIKSIYGIKYGCTDVVANPVGTATGTLETVQIDNTIYELASGTEVDELTLSEYNQLPTTTKNDGKVRFIPHSDVGASQAADMTTQGFYENPSNMNVTDTTSTKTTVTWGGGVQIGCSYYYTTAIDVTDWDRITFDVRTGSCYGGGASAQQPSWDFIIGLLDYEIDSAVNLPASSSVWKVVADLSASNHDYSGTELDVSNLTGELYLTVVCHGWNATVENITLSTLGGYPSQIKYMSETYGIANIEELTEGDYQVLTNVEKNNGTVYFTHDGDEEVDLTVRMTGSTSTSGTASAVGSLNGNFLAWHAFASEDDFDANVNGEYWAGNGEGAYLQFDFANAVSITKVAYASYQYSSFDLMYSTDGTTYNLAETLTQADQGTANPTKQDYILSNSIANVVSIRFVCNGAYNLGALHIYGNDGNLTPNHIYLNGRCYTSYKPRVSFLYWASGFDSTITLDEDIRNFDRIMIFTNGGKPFTCDPRDYFNGNQEYFGVGIASNKYVWYSVGSDGETLTSAYHDGLEITMILGLNDIDTDCPWESSHNQ